MTKTLIVLVDTAGPIPAHDGEFAGQYLASYDPDGMAGFGVFTGTTDSAKAMRFDDIGAALACWKQKSTVRPWRDDGEPNRPLTAFTVTFKTVED